MGDEYKIVVNKIVDKMFYILIESFCYALIVISRTHNTKFVHECMPQWMKRAVFYRDREKCVFCERNLTDLLMLTRDTEIHCNHMISLNQGGMNDVSNIQLLCRECNLSKGTVRVTSNISGLI
ncbi:HNH endonuclease [Anaerobutyricum hallii]|uniref:HNH endonuclease n=1 Tax=Anaerobutyricum hallii TaxID=39488 RepID=UPI003521B836